jgi:hypothetical protein
VVLDEEAKERGRKRKKNDKKPHLSMANPIFDVFGPGRKWADPILPQPNRKWSRHVS